MSIGILTREFRCTMPKIVVRIVKVDKPDTTCGCYNLIEFTTEIIILRRMY